MADSKISQLTNGAPWQGADELAIARAGTSRKMSVTDLFKDPFFGGNLATHRSGAANQMSGFSMGRTAHEFTVATVGSANQFFTGSAAGDSVIAYGSKLWIGTGDFDTAGSMVGVMDSAGNVGIGAVPTSVPSIGNPVIGAHNLIMYNAGDLGLTLLTDNATRTQQIGFGSQGISTFDAGYRYDNLSRVLELWAFSGMRARLSNTGLGLGMTPSAQLELSTDSAKKPSTNTWTISSDERLKENIELADLERCVAIVRALPLKRFSWRDSAYSHERVPDRSKLGWIAQDVQQVFPKAVSTGEFSMEPVIEGFEEVEEKSAIVGSDGEAMVNTVKRAKTRVDVLEDCLALNADQVYAAMYGALQAALSKIEALEARCAALEEKG